MTNNEYCQYLADKIAREGVGEPVSHTEDVKRRKMWAAIRTENRKVDPEHSFKENKNVSIVLAYNSNRQLTARYF